MNTYVASSTLGSYLTADTSALAYRTVSSMNTHVTTSSLNSYLISYEYVSSNYLEI